MPRGISLAVACVVALAPWDLHAADRPKVLPADNHASNLTSDERNEFILRVSTAVGTAMYRGLFSGGENQLFADGGTVYRSRKYNEEMHKDFGSSGTRSPHRTELAADVGMATLNPGKAVEWLRVLKDNGLEITLLWDPIHVEPAVGTDLFNVRADSVNPYGRESYRAQAEHLLRMRDLVSEVPALVPFLDAFPDHSVNSEEAAISVVGTFHDKYSRILIQQQSYEQRKALKKIFGRLFDQTKTGPYSEPLAVGQNPGPVRKDPIQIGIFPKPYDKDIPNKLKYLLSAERYSVEVTRAAARRSFELQRAVAEERRRAENRQREAERLQRDNDRMARIRDFEPRIPRRDPAGPRTDSESPRQRDPDMPRRHEPYSPPSRDPEIRLSDP